MQNRWTREGFQEALDRWAPSCGEALAARIYSARLIGADADLVLHGGGNVSVKDTALNVFDDEIEVVHVKASGGDMSRLEPANLPALRLKQLRRLRKLILLDDDQMVNQVRLQLLNSSMPTPSIETLLHAFLPPKFVDHSHADAVLTLTNQAGGEDLIREALGDRVIILPYIRPGFELAKAVADAVEHNPFAIGAVLMFHGLITFGDDARTSYDRHIELCTQCEDFIESHLNQAFELVVAPVDDLEGTAGKLAPILRGALAEATGDEDHPYEMSILEWRTSQTVLDFVNSDRATHLCNLGALTGDHVMHTRPWALLLREPRWDEPTLLRAQLVELINQFRSKYRDYLEAHGGVVPDVGLSPRVVCIPGLGLFAAGRTKSAAIVTADIAEHTLKVKTQAHRIGKYQSLSDEHLFDMEFRTIQRAKLGAAPNRPLSGQVVAISGAAGAIGAATAECCAQAGAHLLLTDIDELRLQRVVEYLNEQYEKYTVAGVPMDVTDEESVRDGFARAALTFGGVDTIVPNAGVAHVAPIDELDMADFRRVMEVNTFGYFLFMREGIRLMKQQGTGGNIVLIASKNVSAPGKDFAAYSASKAAAHQIGKVAALELGSFDIRVNMINPDAVFGDADIPSGLWEAIAPSRAQSRNLTVEELQEFYRQRNLLKAHIHPHHVGNAVVFFASRQTPTTGATLPVDGGILEAFPR